MMKSHDPWIFTSVVMQSLFFHSFRHQRHKKVRRSLREKKKSSPQTCSCLSRCWHLLVLFRLVDVTPRQMRRRRILRTGLGQPCGARAARQRLNSHGKNEAVQSLFLTMILQERVYFLQLFLGQVHAQHEHQQVRRKSGA